MRCEFRTCDCPGSILQRQHRQFCCLRCAEADVGELDLSRCPCGHSDCATAWPEAGGRVPVPRPRAKRRHASAKS